MKELQRITYVEDEPHIREIVQLTLEELGVLLDVMMPDMDGVQTLRCLRKIPQVAQMPIIFVTAKAQKYEIQQHKSLGALDVIPKPFDPVTLPEDILAIWRRVHGRLIN